MHSRKIIQATGEFSINYRFKWNTLFDNKLNIYKFIVVDITGKELVLCEKISKKCGTSRADFEYNASWKKSNLLIKKFVIFLFILYLHI